MSSTPSPQAERLISLPPGKSTTVPRNPYGLIHTARRYIAARYSVRAAEGHFVVVRVE